MEIISYPHFFNTVVNTAKATQLKYSHKVITLFLNFIELAWVNILMRINYHFSHNSIKLQSEELAQTFAC